MSNGLHQEEKRQFEALIRQMRYDRIGDRLAVVDAFLTSEDHLTAKGWQQHLEQKGVDLAPGFVAETLELLTRLGLATRRQFEDEPPRFEHKHLDEHHDHLICTRCGKITEFHNPRLEELQQQIVSELGFHPLRHRMQVYGLCHGCLASREPTMPLTMASAGERLKVVRILGGEHHRKNLNSMGITIGSQLQVISRNGGPLVVAVKGTRVALGRGAAQKVLVSLQGE
jgi:Fur family ferric uptake transcriptional regulator